MSLMARDSRLYSRSTTARRERSHCSIFRSSGSMMSSLCGIGSLLAWARRVIVDDRHWMSEAEFAETLSLCQFLPGPEIANVSIYVGSKFRGPIGAIVALLGRTAAPLAVGLVLGTLYLRY